jgi:outer membrane protein TolC
MRVRRAQAGICSALLLATAFPAAAETLADAWRAALAVDGRLRAADADADAARASLEAARGLALPKATASSSYTVLSKEPAARIGLPTLPGIALPDQMPLAERTYATHALQATLPVYTGGRITAAINAADIGVQASAFERSRSEQAVKLDVAEAWLGAAQPPRPGRRRAPPGGPGRPCPRRGRPPQAGPGTPQRRLVGGRCPGRCPPAADPRPPRGGSRCGGLQPPPASPPGLAGGRRRAAPVDTHRDALAALAARARSLRPELSLLGARAEATDQEAEVERAARRPQVGLSAALLHEDNRYRVNQDMAQVSIGVQWELFDGGIQRQRADAASARARAARERQADTASLIELEVRREWLAVDEATERLTTTSAAMRQADENLRVARDRYRNGVGTHTEVLDAEALRTLTDGNHLNAHYDLHLARYRLKKAVGEL